MLIRTSELRMLDVINVVDGRRLGNLYDLDIDADTGTVKAIVLPGAGGWLWFGRRPDIEIRWEWITKIGVDVILVRLPQSRIPDGLEGGDGRPRAQGRGGG